MADSQATRDKEFLDNWLACGRSPMRYAEQYAMSPRRVYDRRAAVLGRNPAWAPKLATTPYNQGPADWPAPQCINLDAKGKTFLIGSDLHAWRVDSPPLLWHAFCSVAWSIKPDVIVMNGDVIDGARVSRHPKAPGVNAPKITEEIEAAKTWLGWLPDAQKEWVIGNHDVRVDTYLANTATELEDYAGRLSDRFSDWRFAWSLMVNNTCEIRHRYHCGEHTAWNNVLKAGVSIVTGDTHRCCVRPFQDRRGVRWGVELGMLGDPEHVSFMYNEGKPNQHRRGFAVLTFDEEGALLPPELCEWHDDRATFRGRVVADLKGARVRVKAA